MESNPDIDKDVEHIPVKSASRRKVWLLFLVKATLIVAAAVITTAVFLASKDNESKKSTDSLKPFAIDLLKSTEIRTTNYPQPTASTTGNTTVTQVSKFSNNTLHSTAPLTTMSSTKKLTSYLVAQSQSISSSITSSRQNSLATAARTLLSTSDKDKASSSISLTQSCPPNSTTFNLTRATTLLLLNATPYQTTEAYPTTSETQSESLNTTFSKRSSNTSAPITHVPSSTSVANKPSTLNKISPSSTLICTTILTRNITTFSLPKQFLSSTSIDTATTQPRSSSKKIPGTTSVHISSGHKIPATNTIQLVTGPVYIIFCNNGNKTSILVKPMHSSASSTSWSLTTATSLPVNTSLFTLANATTSRKPLTALITNNSIITTTFSDSLRQKTTPSTILRNITSSIIITRATAFKIMLILQHLRHK